MTTLTITTPAAFSAGASAGLGRALGDSPRVAELRAEGARLAAQLAWPDAYRERPWKYLDVTGMDLGPYPPGAGRFSATASGVRSCPVSGEHAAAIAFENGEAVFEEEAPAGLSVRAFDGRTLGTVETRLGSGIAPGRNRFTALHYAFLRGGVLIEVAPNTELVLPVRVMRTFAGPGQFAAPHTLIVAGANSRVEVVEEFVSGGELLATPVVEAFPGPGATIRYTAVHRWGEDARVFAEQRTVTERDATFSGLSVVTGGRVVKGHIESSLVGRGSASELLALCAGDDSQHVDFYTLQDHIGPDTRSDLLFKSALEGRARGVYYGLTRVGLGARNADANQENRNLLLSKEAKADSDPVLEILTSDIIRCSHGATAGPVDDEQLYYLETRGIPPERAEALLVRAFLNEVLARVAGEALRDELASIVEGKLS
jgi:Fe-S cluster assembly protein SufD